MRALCLLFLGATWADQGAGDAGAIVFRGEVVASANMEIGSIAETDSSALVVWRYHESATPWQDMWTHDAWVDHGETALAMSNGLLIQPGTDERLVLWASL